MVLYENQLGIFIQVFIKVGKNSMYIFRLTYNTDIIDMPYLSGITFVLWGLITWSLPPKPIIKIPTNLIVTNIGIEKIL